MSPTASSAGPTPSASALSGQAAAPAVPVAATSAATTPTPSSSAIPIPSSQATATLPPSPGAGATTHCVTSTGKAGTTPPPCITAQLSYPCPKPGTPDRREGRRTRPSTDWIVACDPTGAIEYALQPASLKGTAVSGAELPPSSRA